MDPTLSRIRLFLAGNASLLLNAVARGSTMFVLSWYFQTVLSNSPLTAGLKLLPLAATMMLIAPLSGRLSDRVGSRWLSTGGLLVTAVGQLWIASLPLSAPYHTLALALAVVGTGNGLFNSPNTSAVMGSVHARLPRDLPLRRGDRGDRGALFEPARQRSPQRGVGGAYQTAASTRRQGTLSATVDDGLARFSHDPRAVETNPVNLLEK